MAEFDYYDTTERYVTLIWWPGLGYVWLGTNQ